MSQHCPACEGRQVYGGEACPVCVPAVAHDPHAPTGFAAWWALGSAVLITIYLVWWGVR